MKRQRLAIGGVALVGATLAGLGLFWPAPQASAPQALAPQASARPAAAPVAQRPLDPIPLPPAPSRIAAPVPPKPPEQAVRPASLVVPSPEALPASMPGIVPPARDSAWRRNAVAAPPSEGRALVAIVIDDMGVDRRRSAAASDLPGPLTLSWLAYAEQLPQQVARARASGHETLVHLPMEPVGNADPGPGALRVGLSETEIVRRVRAALGAVPGAVGLNNHMGSRFTANEAGMALVARELAGQGLLFLDSRTTGSSQGAAQARRHGLPPLARDVFLDDEDDRAAIEKQLGVLEREAKRRGAAIAIGHPRDRTLAALGPFLAGMQSRGLVLVPLSAIAMRLEAQEIRAGEQVTTGRRLTGN